MHMVVGLFCHTNRSLLTLTHTYRLAQMLRSALSCLYAVKCSRTLPFEKFCSCAPQAVRSADYAIAQFRFLQRLLLVHGRNNYMRVCRLVLYIFYKNTVCVTALFLYNIYQGWSGTTLFASLLLMSYNVFFTGVPIVVYGFLEQDVSDANAIKHPQLYIPGQRKENFNAQAYIHSQKYPLQGLLHTNCTRALTFQHMRQVAGSWGLSMYDDVT